MDVIHTPSRLSSDLLTLIQQSPDNVLLDQLSKAALDTRYANSVFTNFESLLTELSARWLELSEHSSVLAAFGRFIAFAPYLTERVEVYLTRNTREDASSGGIFSVDYWTSLSGDQLRDLLLALFRLLSHDNRTFGRYLNASTLALGLSHSDTSVRYLTIRVLCLFLHAADGARHNMMERYITQEIGEETSIEGAWEDKMIDYRFLSMWEERRMKDLTSQMEEVRQDLVYGPKDLPQRHIEAAAFSDITCFAAGVLIPVSKASQQSSSSQFVPTTTSVANLREVAEGLRSGRPLFLHGLAGSGKTMLVYDLARRLHKLDDLVTLHLTEQSDAKSLIGTYTSGSEPGTFEWKAGALTRAVREGRWIFIEDLDRAPAEVISTLLPLIERRQLHMHSRGEIIHASSGFRLIATVRTTQDLAGGERLPNPHMIGSHFWTKIHVQSLAVAELHEFVCGLFPGLSALSAQIMAVFEQLRLLTAQRSFAARLKTGMARAITPRDLLKWCRRVAAIVRDANVITEKQLDEIMLEAVDCFAGYLPAGEILEAFAASIAQNLHIDPARRDHIMNARSITFQSSSKGVPTLQVGRSKVRLQLLSSSRVDSRRPFALNGHTLRLMEKLAVGVQHREPMLLVGETGTGKTTCIQYLAERIGCKLVPFNLSQQSEVSDLLGGLKPVSTRTLITPLRDEFEELFPATFSQKGSQAFTNSLRNLVTKGQWKAALKMWTNACREVEKAFGSLDTSTNGQQANGEQPSKRQKTNKGEKVQKVLAPELRERWLKFKSNVQVLESQLSRKTSAFAFAYIEGSLVKAVRDGHWLLLDEINLASSDTLEALIDLLSNEGDNLPSLTLTESGNLERIIAHPNFRVFAAMNPATDVGKKDLPAGIRSRFTELFVDSPDKDRKSLESVVESYLGEGLTDRRIIGEIATLYLRLHELLDGNKLVDGSGQKPHFSLRTLTRTLGYAKSMAQYCNLRRALCEGFLMSFTTLLDKQSESLIVPLITQAMLARSGSAAAELRKPLGKPQDGRSYVQEGSFWLKQGTGVIQSQDHYIITPFVRRNLDNLIRAVSTNRFPILLQGPTSSGKTSMVEYVAKRSGNQFVRINNHEHTDLQEYLGSYVSDANGILKFQDGVLVQALRNGYWIVLDELNLAPTDVLEALNRLLDDNRELLIPETQEVIRPHPDFMLFATQNPAGLYGGRKHLSRAFRNRFLELHFDDIPVNELCDILHQRTLIPESWARRIVEVYKELSNLRQEARLFEQKSFATLRDLFRWALRSADSVHQLAVNGFMLLAERVRKADERDKVRQVIEDVMSRRGPKVRISEDALYEKSASPEFALFDSKSSSEDVVWTKAMRRLFVLVAHAVRNNEPILLVGETGCGKTTVCQILADAFEKRLFTINAHQNIETGDIIGSQRPVRNKAGLQDELRELLKSLLATRDSNLVSDDLDSLITAFDHIPAEDTPADIRSQITTLRTQLRALFEWHDGALVEAMRTGQLFLLDEISLADDSVLERLNSVLEPERTMLLAEKGSIDAQVTAAQGFQFMATMNPGGDYGKRELSPALRNRFTEIWVPAILDNADILDIVQHKLGSEKKTIAPVIVGFAHWFAGQFHSSASAAVSIRDVLAWIAFINKSNSTDPAFCLYHGAALVFIDTLGANPAAILSIEPTAIAQKRQQCVQALEHLSGMDLSKFHAETPRIMADGTYVQIGDFGLPQLPSAEPTTTFALEAPTTKLNAMRLFRALQLAKPVLLEGNPGVGKTTLVSAIAQILGRHLVRINLSEQTDLMDLFGSDVPVEGAVAGTFAWRDASFLSAMKNGDWVLLDEMNLASQSVLEGLNACLDHRGEVFIAELHQTFTRHPDFRIFAAQNPHHQGGGRKGLPSSFVNRFTVVYADVFRPDDLQLICQRSFPEADPERIDRIIKLVSNLDDEVAVKRRFGAMGSPWEFNLRDTLRWLHLAHDRTGLLSAANDYDLSDMIFRQRFRQPRDQAMFDSLVTASGQSITPRSFYHTLTTQHYQVGLALVSREEMTAAEDSAQSIANHLLPIVETSMICVQRQWPLILIGSAGSGKSHVLQHVAAIVGKTLTTFPLDADIDSMDLVGGFEQADNMRLLSRVMTRIHIFASKWSIVCCQQAQAAGLRQYSDLLVLAKSGPTIENISRARAILEALAEQNEEATELAMSCREAEGLQQIVQAAQFQWVDGPLVQALQEGHWLVLDNANLCSSSVLDRINSLLEPNGYLSINEHPTVDGQPRIVRPHPDFRIFLTMDPRHGELSRAMRNRGVEVYLPPVDFAKLRGADVATVLDCTTYRFRNFDDRPSPILCDSRTTTTDAMADHLTFADKILLESFRKEVQKGLLGTRPVNAELDTIETFSLGWSDITNFCSSTTEHDLARSISSLNIQNNETLLRQMPDFLETSRAQTWRGGAILQLLRIGRSLQEKASLPVTDRPKTVLDISRLKPRYPSMEIGSASQVWDFLTALHESLLYTVRHSSAELPQSQSIDRIITMFDRLLRLVDATTYEEAYFQIHLQIAREALPNGVQTNVVTNGVGPHSPSDLVLGFATPIQRKTGLQMESLWQALRPSTCTTNKQLEDLLELESLADRFDQTVDLTTASLREVVQYRQALQEAIHSLLVQGSDVSSLLPELSNILDSMSTPQAESTSGPFFAETFGRLRALVQLNAADPDRTGQTQDEYISLYARLAAYSGLATKDLSSVNMTGKNQDRASGQFGFHHPLVDATLFDPVGLLPALQQNMSGVAEVAISGLDLLVAELNLLGQTVGSSAAQICTDPVRSARGVLEDIATSFQGTSHGQQLLGHAQAIGLTDSEDATIPDPRATGLAWLKFAIKLIFAYIPDKAFDPALKLSIQRQFHIQDQTKVESGISGLMAFEEGFSGQHTNLRIRLAQDELLQLGQHPPDAAVARPAVSRLTELQTLFNAGLQLASKLQDYLQGLNVEVDAVIKSNLVQIVRRLTSDYASYRDLTGPLVTFSQYINIGLALLQVSQSPQSQRQGALTSLRLLATSDEDAMKMSGSQDDLANLRLNAAAIGASQVTQAEAFQRQSHDPFDNMYREWRTKLKIDSENEAKKSSLYVFQGDEAHDDEVDEEDFRSLFADDYDEAEELEDVKVEPAKTPIMVSDPQKMAVELAKLHANTYLSHVNPVSATLELLKDEKQSYASSGEALPTTMLTIQERKKQLEASESGRTPNFYFDSNINEAKILLKLARLVRSRFVTIQQTWPEHATLAEVIKICDELAAMRHSDPVAKLITKLEKLHETIHEWQTVASREFSAVQLYDEVKNLIVSWRRIELSTWSSLLDNEVQKMKDAAQSWWFVCFENIIASPKDLIEQGSALDFHVQPLIATLQDFLTSTPFGQYRERIVLLRQFQAHLLALKGDDTASTSLDLVYNGLTNLIDIFERFMPAVAEQLQKGRSKFEKDVKEIIQLASWKDTTIEALRQSAKQSHRKLFKVVRKFRALLSQSVESIVNKGIPDQSLSLQPLAAISEIGLVDENYEEATRCCEENLPSWSTAPTRFTNKLATLKLMRQTASTKTKFDTVTYLEARLNEHMSTVAELQKETPSLLTAENKDTVKSLKQQKRVLFADILKDMRSMGLQHNLDVATVTAQNSASLVLSKILPFSTLSTTMDTKAASYHFTAFADLMLQIRDIGREHHGDLTPAEVIRSLGYFEALLQRAVQSRNAAALAISQAGALSRNVAVLSAIWAAAQGVVSTQTSQISEIDRLDQTLTWLLPVLEVFETLIRTQAELGTLKFDAPIAMLVSGRTDLAQHQREIQATEEKLAFLITAKQKEHVEAIRQRLHALEEDVRSASKAVPNLQPILDQLLPWLAIPIATDEPESTDHSTQDAFEADMFAAVDQTLGATQDLSKALSQLPESRNDKSWLNQEEQAIKEAQASLHVSLVAETLIKLTQHLRRLPTDRIRLAAALTKTLSPILQQFEAVCQHVAQRQLRLNTILCKTGHHLAKVFIRVGKEGFCTPSEKTSGEDGQTDKLEGGTGLGEGEGAEDISKDIGADEDLTELAEEKDKNERKDEIEDEKDAVDMADAEMEGQMGEEEEQEEGDKKSDDGEGSDGEDEMDEETGDVDDLGPSAVDEKMWDDGEQTDKDKEGDQGAGTKQDDAVAANEEKEKGQQGDEEQEEVDTGADETEDGPQEQGEKVDEHLEEGDKLDLPEDMQLDGASAKDDDEEDGLDDLGDDMDMEDDLGEDEGEEAPPGEGDDEQDADAMSVDDEINQDETEDQPGDLDQEAGSEVDQLEQDGEQENDEPLPQNADDANAAEDQVQNEAQAQGLDAEDQANNDNNKDTAASAQRQQGETSEESKNSGGEAAEPGEEQQGKQDAVGRSDQPESSDRQAFRKLGEILERWHKQNNPIQPAQEETEDQKSSETKKEDADLAQADFQHLLDENTEADTQALGAAAMDQAKALNEDMAIQTDDRSDEKPPVEDHDGPTEPRDQDTTMQGLEDSSRQPAEPQDSSMPNAFIGEQKSNQRQRDDRDDAPPVDNESDVEDVDAQLSTVHLDDDEDVVGPPTDSATARQLWAHYSHLTRPLAATLTSHLQLILAPTLATKLRGDFRTGKRLNIKRIIPYIASGYKRDKIWLRRSVPSKRAYQVILAIDDSKSMAAEGVKSLAYQTLAIVGRALAMLEVGELSVVSFGADVKIAHEFGTPFTDDAGARTFEAFGFDQDKTDVRGLIKRIIDIFAIAKARQSSAGQDLWQLCLVVSDGICEDHETVRALVRQAQEERIMLVFVVVDAPALVPTFSDAALNAPAKQQSIMDLQTASFAPDAVTGELKLDRKRYMDTFPFRWWVVVRDVEELPGVLAQALRQWFREIVDVVG